MDKRLIETNGLGLILMVKEIGIFYTNQTGGYACNHPEQEGIFIPLAISNLTNQLERYFTGPKHQGWCNKLDAEDADFLDRLFQYYKLDFVVFRDALNSSEEAWVYVIMTRTTKSYQRDEIAILVWENSD